MIALAWKWLASHGAPIIAALLAGYLYGRAAEREDGLKADLVAARAAITDAAGSIRAAGEAAAAAAVTDAQTQTLILSERERFYAALDKLPARVGDCRLDPADRERLRLAAEVANRFAAGAVPGGIDGGAGETIGADR